MRKILTCYNLIPRSGYVGEVKSGTNSESQPPLKSEAQLLGVKSPSGCASVMEAGYACSTQTSAQNRILLIRAPNGWFE